MKINADKLIANIAVGFKLADEKLRYAEIHKPVFGDVTEVYAGYLDKITGIFVTIEMGQSEEEGEFDSIYINDAPIPCVTKEAGVALFNTIAERIKEVSPYTNQVGDRLIMAGIARLAGFDHLVDDCTDVQFEETTNRGE